MVNSKTRRSAEQRRSRHYNWGSADRVFKELFSSDKFKRYCYARCGRVIKTRVSGGKIRQDSKIENQ
ncbi:hypothetical protein [Prevotella sp.]